MSEMLREKIEVLKKSRGAVILAHNYEPAEIQDIADITGDSLGLSIEAARLEAPVIVFCGVSFMAESAAILAPDKRVVLPKLNCGCGLADMATAAAVREKRRRHPGAVVVTYVNSSAAVKAESDICCTSGNAVNVVNSIPAEKEIIFVPDRNLGSFVEQQTGRQLLKWDGFCPVHEQLAPQAVARARAAHPEALVIVHPECRPEVAALADAVLSTGGMFDYVRKSAAREFIIGTEEGMLHPLRRECPEKVFHPVAANSMICRDMKLISLADLARALETLEPTVTVDPAIADRARRALRKMLEIPR